jgi:hypothetical protein
MYKVLFGVGNLFITNTILRLPEVINYNGFADIRWNDLNETKDLLLFTYENQWDTDF